MGFAYIATGTGPGGTAGGTTEGTTNGTSDAPGTNNLTIITPANFSAVGNGAVFTSIASLTHPGAGNVTWSKASGDGTLTLGAGATAAIQNSYDAVLGGIKYTLNGSDTSETFGLKATHAQGNDTVLVNCYKATIEASIDGTNGAALSGDIGATGNDSRYFYLELVAKDADGAVDTTYDGTVTPYIATNASSTDADLSLLLNCDMQCSTTPYASGSASAYTWGGTSGDTITQSLWAAGDAGYVTLRCKFEGLTEGGTNFFTMRGEAPAAGYVEDNGTINGLSGVVIGNPDPEDDEFGCSIAIDGSYLISGIYDDHDAGATAGAAYIYNYSGGSWRQQAKITASDASEYGDCFGGHVDIDGDYAVCAAPFHYENVGGWWWKRGAAYVFLRSGTNWNEQGSYFPTDGATDQTEFGSSIGISGNYMIVGRERDNSDAGAAYIFNRSGDTWSQQAKLTASDAATDDYFGRDVDISGDYAIVGAPLNDDDGANSGAAYVFKRSGTSWSQQAKITADDGTTGDRFGGVVSIDGDYVAIGASLADGTGENSGAAYVFKRSGTSWSQQAKLLSDDIQHGDFLGEAIAIHGDYVIVGAPYKDEGANSCGAAYLFKRSGTNWTQEKKLLSNNPQALDSFGAEVSVDGTNVVVANYHIFNPLLHIFSI